MWTQLNCNNCINATSIIRCALWFNLTDLHIHVENTKSHFNFVGHTLSKQISSALLSQDSFELKPALGPTERKYLVLIVSDSFSCHNKRKSDLCNANPTTELVHSSVVVFSIYKTKSLLRYCCIQYEDWPIHTLLILYKYAHTHKYSYTRILKCTWARTFAIAQSFVSPPPMQNRGKYDKIKMKKKK